MADHRRLCLASTLRNVTVQHFTDIHKLHQSRDICLYSNFDSLHRRDVDAVGLDLLINLKKKVTAFYAIGGKTGIESRFMAAKEAPEHEPVWSGETGSLLCDRLPFSFLSILLNLVPCRNSANFERHSLF